jgi:hypothetical protein
MRPSISSRDSPSRVQRTISSWKSAIERHLLGRDSVRAPVVPLPRAGLRRTADFSATSKGPPPGGGGSPCRMAGRGGPPSNDGKRYSRRPAASGALTRWPPGRAVNDGEPNRRTPRPTATSATPQPGSFEGHLPVGVEADSGDLPIAERPHRSSSVPHRNSVVAGPSVHLGKDHDFIIGVDVALVLHLVGLPGGKPLLPTFTNPLYPGEGESGARVRAGNEYNLNIVREEVGGAPAGGDDSREVAEILNKVDVRGLDGLDDLHVLLRHRPRSISRACPKRTNRRDLRNQDRI